MALDSIGKASSSRLACQETADEYANVVCYLNPECRVIRCRDNVQWILQRRKKGGAERPWRSVGYCTTRKAIIRLRASSCGPIAHETMAVLERLPERCRPDS